MFCTADGYTVILSILIPTAWLLSFKHSIVVFINLMSRELLYMKSMDDELLITITCWTTKEAVAIGDVVGDEDGSNVTFNN